MDEDLKEALKQLAVGGTYEDKVYVVKPDGRPKEIRITKKHIPPSMEAIKLIDKMKREEKW